MIHRLKEDMARVGAQPSHYHNQVLVQPSHYHNQHRA